ncbi:MAG: hypothetical protein RLZZ299_518 [Pseudomonadota bacterium]|jgi:predicted RNA-binding protein YlqC (UPF0109 family)
MERAEDTHGQIAEIKGLVVAIVRALVDHPDDVSVTEIEGTHACVLELNVAPGDVGKVIGRKGIHADALRRIVHAIGGKHRRRYVLEILEEHAVRPLAASDG